MLPQCTYFKAITSSKLSRRTVVHPCVGSVLIKCSDMSTQIHYLNKTMRSGHFTRGCYYTDTTQSHTKTTASPAFLSTVPHATGPIRFVNDTRTSGHGLHFMNEVLQRWLPAAERYRNPSNIPAAKSRRRRLLCAVEYSHESTRISAKIAPIVNLQYFGYFLHCSQYSAQMAYWTASCWPAAKRCMNGQVRLTPLAHYYTGLRAGAAHSRSHLLLSEGCQVAGYFLPCLSPGQRFSVNATQLQRHTMSYEFSALCLRFSMISLRKLVRHS